jgi:hypothetical protein
MKELIKRVLREEENDKLTYAMTKFLNVMFVPNHDGILCGIKVTPPEERANLKGEGYGTYTRYEVDLYFIGGYRTKFYPTTQAVMDKYYKITDEVVALMYNVFGKIVDTHASYSKDCDQVLKETINEQAIPSYIKRRVDLKNVDKLIAKHKLTSFVPKMSLYYMVEKTIVSVLGDIIPEDFSDEDYIDCYDNLKPYLFKIYGDDLTEYFKDRKEKYDNRLPSKEKYTFVKHDKPYEISGWAGFTESFDYFDDLVNRFGTWVDVDWDEIKNKLDNIKDYPEGAFTKWASSRPLRIKSINDEGNTWGYNFSIIKSIEK